MSRINEGILRNVELERMVRGGIVRQAGRINEAMGLLSATLGVGTGY